MRIVATCTTLPDRYQKLLLTLKTLHEQTIKFDAIYLTLPYKAKRLNKDYPELPNEIKDLCTVVRTDIDYGPICKIYGALINENEPNTMIITIDDDCIYPNHFVETFIEKSNIQPNAAITGTGVLVGSGAMFLSINMNIDRALIIKGLLGFDIPTNGRRVDIVQGVSGVLYKRHFFPPCNQLDDLFTLPLKNEDLFKSDDIVISGYLSKKNILRYTFNQMPIVHITQTNDDALSVDMFKMCVVFKRALYKSREYGYFPYFENHSIAESPAIKIPLVIIVSIILLILFIIIIYKKNL